MIREDSDVALLRIFEGCLELAPQKTLQISILLSHGNTTVFQYISIGSAFMSMTWLMVFHDKYARLARTDKNPLTLWGILIRGIWQFFIIGKKCESLLELNMI